MAETNPIAENTPTILENEMIPWVFTDEHDNPAPFQVLDMFYRGVMTNTIGIMAVKRVSDGSPAMLLVGVEKTEGDNVEIYPLAELLNHETSTKYIPPTSLRAENEPVTDQNAK